MLVQHMWIILGQEINNIWDFATYCREHIHIEPPGICMSPDTDQGKRQALPPLHTVYGCCICKTNMSGKLKKSANQFMF